VHPALPPGLDVASGQSMLCSTSLYMKIPIIIPTATPINPIIYEMSNMSNYHSLHFIFKIKII